MIRYTLDTPPSLTVLGMLSTLMSAMDIRKLIAALIRSRLIPCVFRDLVIADVCVVRVPVAASDKQEEEL